jgi:glycosyltransferase involved in cell wall biosynthesis
MAEVVHVTPQVFSRDLRGGGERYPLELARAMARHVPTRLVSFGRVPGRSTDQGLEVVTLPLRGCWQGEPLNPLSERLPLALAGARTIHAHQYKSIVTNLCILLGRATGKRVFCTDHGGSARHYGGELRLARLLDGLLAVSAFAAAQLPVPASRVAVIHGGVDPTRFHPDPGVDRRPEVVFVGRVLPHKGLDVLIRALGPETPLHVYGALLDRGYLAALEQLAAGKQVRFHPAADDAEIIAAYRRCRVAVLPSVAESRYGYAAANSELLGLVLLEAMACGTPVVASSLGGIPEIVRDGDTGFLVSPGDERALADRIAVLLRDERCWQAMSRAAADHVAERFTWDRVAVRCLEAYDAARSGRRGRAEVGGPALSQEHHG